MGLETECRRWDELRQDPEQKDPTIAQAMAAERAILQPMVGPVDGFYYNEHAATGTRLISFDRNPHSLMAEVAQRTVKVLAHSDRVVVRCDGEVVDDHRRFFVATGPSMIRGITSRCWRPSPEMLAALLRAETSHRHAASIRYRMAAAKLPAVKDLHAIRLRNPAELAK